MINIVELVAGRNARVVSNSYIPLDRLPDIWTEHIAFH
jgi:hypothetical protein